MRRQRGPARISRIVRSGPTVGARRPALKVPIALKFAVFITVLVVAFMTWQSFTAIDAAQSRLEAEINKSGVVLVTAIASLLDPGWVEDLAHKKDLEAALSGFIRSRGAAQVLDIVVYDSKGQAVATATGKGGFKRTSLKPVEDASAGETGVQVGEFLYDGLPVRSFSVGLSPGRSASETDPIPAGHIEVNLSAAAIEFSRKELATAMTKVSITACIVAAAGAFFLSSFLARPIRVLLKDMMQVSLGNLEHQSNVRSSDELGDLARAFNSMTLSLKAAQEIKLAQRAMEHELSLAASIQSKLLPASIPQPPGFDIAVYYAPAKEVGGDYYDFLQVDGRHLGFVVADVSGKGIPASLVMTMTRSLLRMAAHGETAPAPPVDLLNRSLASDMKPGMFVTLVYTIVDLESHEVRMVRAGHNPPLFFGARQGRLITIEPRGIGIGLDREGSRFRAELQTQRFVLQPGDFFAAYTDGVTEGKDREGRDYSEQRFRTVLESNAARKAQDIVDSVVTDLSQHSHGMEPSDDITLLIVKRSI